MPALQITASRRAPSARMVATAARTDWGSASSMATATVLPVLPEATLSQAAWAFVRSRAVPMTRAPRLVRTRRVSRPSPELQPVTTMVLPAREIPSVTSSAVEP